MRLLPKWALLNPPPAIYDLESVTPLQQTARVYGAMQEMIREYNNFADQINKEIAEFVESSEAEIRNFKETVENRICCKFRDMDAAFNKFRLEMKQYTDITLEKAFDIFGVTVEATGERIVLTDAAEEEIRGLSIYGKTIQAWDPVPEYPSVLQSSGASGIITAVIMDGTGNKQQEITLATPDGLPGIPVADGGNYTDAAGQEWICDEIDLKRGVYVQRVKEIALDGSSDEVWYEDANDGIHRHIIGFTNVYRRPSGRTECICTHAKYGQGVDTGTCFIGSEGAFYFYKNDSEHAAFIEWLRSNTINVLYALAEPVEIPLPVAELAAFEKLHTYSPETTITNESGAGMKVEYVAITQLYMDNRIQTLATEKAEQMISAALAAGTLTVGVEYNDATEELNIIAQEV